VGGKIVIVILIIGAMIGLLNGLRSPIARMFGMWTMIGINATLWYLYDFMMIIFFSVCVLLGSFVGGLIRAEHDNY